MFLTFCEVPCLFIYFDNPGIVLGYFLGAMFIMIPQPRLKVTDWVQNKLLIYVSIVTGSNKLHCEEYRNFTWFPGVDILRKGTVSIPGNQMKLRYFSQCYAEYSFKGDEIHGYQILFDSDSKIDFTSHGTFNWLKERVFQSI